MSKANKPEDLADTLDLYSKKNEGVTSVNMSFEGRLTDSPKLNNTYKTEWIDSEIKKSNNYFTKEIYSTE